MCYFGWYRDGNELFFHQVKLADYIMCFHSFMIRDDIIGQSIYNKVHVGY
jgi:hypothetical protein